MSTPADRQPPSLRPPTWEFITPARASSIRSAANRPLKPSVVAEYARLMRAGMWRPSPHGLCIQAVDGRENVVDGQHRLAALASLAGAVSGLWFLVCRWDVPAVELRVDRGSNRQLADFSGMTPHAAAPYTALAGIARITPGLRYDPSEIAPVVAVFRPFGDALAAACPSACRGRTTGGVRAGVIAAMATDPGRAGNVAAAYRAMVLDHADCPPAFRSLRRQADTSRMDSTEIAAKAFRAGMAPDQEKLIMSPELIPALRDAVRAVLARR